jgi:Alpha-(1,6)-fucosyltransferase N- and catalytic domains
MGRRHASRNNNNDDVAKGEGKDNDDLHLDLDLLLTSNNRLYDDDDMAVPVVAVPVTVTVTVEEEEGLGRGGGNQHRRGRRVRVDPPTSSSSSSGDDDSSSIITIGDVGGATSKRTHTYRLTVNVSNRKCALIVVGLLMLLMMMSTMVFIHDVGKRIIAGSISNAKETEQQQQKITVKTKTKTKKKWFWSSLLPEEDEEEETTHLPSYYPSTWWEDHYHNHIINDNDNDNNDNTTTTTTIEEDIIHILQTKQKYVFVLELGGKSINQGLGSIIFMAWLFETYFAIAAAHDVSTNNNETVGRVLVLDQSHYEQYRPSPNQGLFSGFFDTDFPVLDDPQQKQRIIAAGNNVVAVAGESGTGTTETKTSDVFLPRDVRTVLTSRQITQTPVITLSEIDEEPWRRTLDLYVHIMDYFCHTYTAIKLYEKMIPFACNVRINDITMKTKIIPLLQQYAIPTLVTTETTSTEAAMTATSVAFHIRRSDKVISGESKAYEVQEYVDRLAFTLSYDEMIKIEICFLATDDVTVIDQVHTALLNSHINCTLHTLSDKDMKNHYTQAHQYKDRNGDHAVFVLADIHMLVSATYFVGTYSSNIGRIVSLWRGCHYDRHHNRNHNNINRWIGANVTNKFHHYFHSYGVDQEDWTPTHDGY